MEIGPIASAIGVIATGAFAFIKWYLPWRRERSLNANTISGLQSISRVYETMKEIEESAVERVILFAGHNGGGIPSASKPFYVTALHWVADAESSKIIEDYVNIRVDAEYVTMLLTIRERGFLMLETKSMPDCKLKHYFQLEGVTASMVVFLTVKDKRFYYFSASTKSDHGIDENMRSRILLKAEKIANELERKSTNE